MLWQSVICSEQLKRKVSGSIEGNLLLFLVTGPLSTAWNSKEPEFRITPRNSHMEDEVLTGLCLLENS